MRALPLRRTGRHAAALAVTVGMLGSGFLMYQSSQAAFSGSASNAGNRFSAGTVSLGTSSGATAMFSQGTNGYLKPGSNGVFCIQVNYTGNVASTAITLTPTGYTNAGNTFATYPLGAKVNLMIEQSTDGTAVKADCDADNATWTGAKAIIFGGAGGAKKTVAQFDSLGGATVNGPWTPSTTDHRVFKFSWDVDSTADDNYKNATTDIGFTWTSGT
jgi:hypothetical protein